MSENPNEKKEVIHMLTRIFCRVSTGWFWTVLPLISLISSPTCRVPVNTRTHNTHLFIMHVHHKAAATRTTTNQKSKCSNDSYSLHYYKAPLQISPFNTMDKPWHCGFLVPLWLWIKACHSKRYWNVSLSLCTMWHVMLHVISAWCIARDLHTIAPGPLEHMC